MKLKIDDLNTYHSKDFDSVEHLEEVLQGQLSKVRNVETIENEMRRLHMRSDDLDGYVNKMRTLMQAHYVSSSDTWKQNNIEATEELRKMNEAKVIRYFIKGLASEIQYRISSSHSVLDEAIKEAYLLYDETERQHRSGSSQHKTNNHHKSGSSRHFKSAKKDDKKSAHSSAFKSNSPKKSGDVTCFNCGIKGHKSDVCRKPKTQRGPKNLN